MKWNDPTVAPPPMGDIRIKLRDGSELSYAIPQADGDYWWRERFFGADDVVAWCVLDTPPTSDKGMGTTPNSESAKSLCESCGERHVCGSPFSATVSTCKLYWRIA